jgi:hypothetical protein
MLPPWPSPLQTFALVVSPRLRLRHVMSSPCRALEKEEENKKKKTRNKRKKILFSFLHTIITEVMDMDRFVALSPMQLLS